MTTQNGAAIVTEKPNALNELVKTSGGGLMRFAGTVSAPSSVLLGGKPATVNSDNTFEGFAQVAPDTTTRVHIVASNGAGGAVTDKYVDVTPATVTPNAFAYDANGNTISSGAVGAPNVTYGWDAANRLVTITQGSDVTKFDYDGQGRRVRESLNGTELRHWVWCGLELCEERDVTNSVTKQFFGQGEQISGTNYYYTRDHLGSIREMTAAGNVTHARYDYHLYGKRSGNLVTTSPVDSDFGFTGHYFHSSSGLYLAPYRAYNASVGRWLSRDPIGENGGIDLYGYVGNSPGTRTDPQGLWYLSNPVTWFDGGGYEGLSGHWDAYQAVTADAFQQGAYAALDGFNPFGNPIANNGFYKCDEGAMWSRRLGRMRLR